MQVATVATLVTLVLLLATLAGVIALQIFLSRREAAWPGLIMPVLSLLFSLLTVLSMVLYMVAPSDTSAWAIGSTAGGVFLMGNIPTVIYLGIYFACREKRRRKKQMEKMNIQDLEG